MSPLTPRDRGKACVLASLAGDALALGAHWEYDPAAIDDVLGRVETYQTPMTHFHEGKSAGQFTHYGDQTLMLLQSVIEKTAFDFHDFHKRWRALFSDYDGYVDKATRETMEGLMAGKGPGSSGSHSHDLGGAARIAPLVYVLRDDLPALERAAVEQTRMTHDTDEVADAALFLARTSHHLIHGTPLQDAMDKAAAGDYASKAIPQWLEAGRKAVGKPPREAILMFGQACPVGYALPAVVYLVSAYPDDLQTCLVENVMAGGDSAARGLAAGMLLGAALGPDAIPAAWRDGFAKADVIHDLLDTAP